MKGNVVKEVCSSCGFPLFSDQCQFYAATKKNAASIPEVEASRPLVSVLKAIIIMMIIMIVKLACDATMAIIVVVVDTWWCGDACYRFCFAPLATLDRDVYVCLCVCVSAHMCVLICSRRCVIYLHT